MKGSLFLAGLLLSIQSTNVGAAECNVSKASSILKGVSTAKKFCSSLLYPNGPCTETKRSTTTTTTCSTSYKTKTKRVVFTDYTYTPVTLPTITRYIYDSTVFVPSGTILTGPPSKRSAAPASAAPEKAGPTPTALSTCSARVISSACSSFATDSTITTTKVTTITKSCPNPPTTTVTITINTATTTIDGGIQEISPAPVVISTTGVLTTTVPAACAGPVYEANGNGETGDYIKSVQYPYFALTALECCVACFDFNNCVASAFIASGLDCQLLIKNSTNGEATTAKCPLGIEDYPFIGPTTDGAAYPGPCGY